MDNSSRRAFQRWEENNMQYYYHIIWPAGRHCRARWEDISKNPWLFIHGEAFQDQQTAKDNNYQIVKRHSATTLMEGNNNNDKKRGGVAALFLRSKIWAIFARCRLNAVNCLDDDGGDEMQVFVLFCCCCACYCRALSNNKRRAALCEKTTLYYWALHQVAKRAARNNKTHDTGWPQSRWAFPLFARREKHYKVTTFGYKIMTSHYSNKRW